MSGISGPSKAEVNAKAIAEELAWFQQLVSLRVKITFEQSMDEKVIQSMKLPSMANSDSLYGGLVRECEMTMEERLLLILALIPHVRPSLLDFLQMKNEVYDLPFTEFGGINNGRQKGYLPTGETAVFLLAGSDLEKRFDLMQLLDRDHFFHRKQILGLGAVSDGEPRLNGILSLNPEYVSLLTTGESYWPESSRQFPAKRISTDLDWEDLIVSESTAAGLEEIKDYLSFGIPLKNDFEFGKKIAPGFRVLFTGPPGTGKTLTASLLGKSHGLAVYKVDLSLVVSKFIGETEKNLSSIFDIAENKGWILFFDEADALFGKRVDVSDAHDRYANQEISYFMHRIESYKGLVILSSNYKRNIDEPFYRRFQLIVEFEMPTAYQRLRLWKNSKTNGFEYDDQTDLETLAEDYELGAASIINVLHYALLKCLKRNDRIIWNEDILSGIKIQIAKDGNPSNF